MVSFREWSESVIKMLDICHHIPNYEARVILAVYSSTAHRQFNANKIAGDCARTIAERYKSKKQQMADFCEEG